jgi:hypothetical protein
MLSLCCSERKKERKVFTGQEKKNKKLPVRKKERKNTYTGQERKKEIYTGQKERKKEKYLPVKKKRKNNVPVKKERKKKYIYRSRKKERNIYAGQKERKKERKKNIPVSSKSCLSDSVRENTNCCGVFFFRSARQGFICVPSTAIHHDIVILCLTALGVEHFSPPSIEAIRYVVAPLFIRACPVSHKIRIDIFAIGCRCVESVLFEHASQTDGLLSA